MPRTLVREGASAVCNSWRRSVRGPFAGPHHARAHLAHAAAACDDADDEDLYAGLCDDGDIARRLQQEQLSEVRALACCTKPLARSPRAPVVIARPHVGPRLCSEAAPCLPPACRPACRACSPHASTILRHTWPCASRMQLEAQVEAQRRELSELSARLGDAETKVSARTASPRAAHSRRCSIRIASMPCTSPPLHHAPRRRGPARSVPTPPNPPNPIPMARSISCSASAWCC